MADAVRQRVIVDFDTNVEKVADSLISTGASVAAFKEIYSTVVLSLKRHNSLITLLHTLAATVLILRQTSIIFRRKFPFVI